LHNIKESTKQKCVYGLIMHYILFKEIDCRQRKNFFFCRARSVTIMGSLKDL